MPLDAPGVARAVTLSDEGFRQRYVARVLGTPRTTVRDAVKRFWETGACTRRPR